MPHSLSFIIVILVVVLLVTWYATSSKVLYSGDAERILTNLELVEKNVNNACVVDSFENTIGLLSVEQGKLEVDETEVCIRSNLPFRCRAFVCEVSSNLTIRLDNGATLAIERNKSGNMTGVNISVA